VSGIITCQREATLPVSEFRRVLDESGLGRIRPLDDEQRLQRMLDGAALLVTARRPSGELVGVARCLTDSAWVAYVSELAVCASAQSMQVGRRLLQKVRDELGPEVMLVLASVPEATGFYERFGMSPLPDAFYLRRER
jgi:GNAT superfamily N-acetyltransferase